MVRGLLAIEGVNRLCNDTPFRQKKRKKKKENVENLVIFGGTHAGPLKP